MRGEIVVGVHEGVLRERLQVCPPALGGGVSKEDLVLGALDRSRNRDTSLPCHLRTINADRDGGECNGIRGSHAHRVGQGRLLPLLLRAQQALKRSEFARCIEELFDLGGVLAELSRVELSRPGEEISERDRDVALVPTDRADQATRKRNTALKDVEIMTAQDHEIVTFAARNTDLPLVDVGQNLLGLS